MKNYTIKYELESDPSELFESKIDGASIGDALYNFYKSSDEFNYETPVIIDILERCMKNVKKNYIIRYPQSGCTKDEGHHDRQCHSMVPEPLQHATQRLR